MSQFQCVNRVVRSIARPRRNTGLKANETGAWPWRLNGYARVSTADQNSTLQEHALRAAGCEVIRAEKVSATRREGRTELALLLEFLRRGDTLVVTRADRLARSIKDLQDIVHLLKERGVTLRATEQPINTQSATGKAFLDMLGVFAEFEMILRRERQLEGIAAAKARGVYRGRKPSIDPAEIRRLRVEEKLGATAIARRLGIGRRRCIAPSPAVMVRHCETDGDSGRLPLATAAAAGSFATRKVPSVPPKLPLWPKCMVSPRPPCTGHSRRFLNHAPCIGRIVAHPACSLRRSLNATVS